ncbi:MAG: peptidylprolyl isomerase [Bacillota bacterium]|nr:peptidylprolyl isomerase [Bacillota bacterium]
MSKTFSVKTVGLMVVIAALVTVSIWLWWSSQDQALALVNGEKLTKEQLYREMYDSIGAETQEALIDKMLVLQEGKKNKVNVTAEEVEAELSKLKDMWGVSSDAEVEQLLALQGGSTTLEKLEEQITLWLTVRHILAPTIKLSDQEIQQYFADHQDEFGEPEQVKVRHILVTTEEEAKSILKELRSGADFAKVAREKSIDPGSASGGGDLGFIKRGEMVPEFEAAAFALAEGEVSDIVKSEHGYHIIQVLEKKAAVKPDFAKVKADVEALLMDQKVQEKYQSWLQELRDAANIKYSKP